MSRAVTPWFTFASRVTPKRRGVYATQLLGNVGSILDQGFSFWNGKRWGDSRSSVEGAFRVRNTEGSERKNWRGLTKEAK